LLLGCYASKSPFQNDDLILKTAIELAAEDPEDAEDAEDADEREFAFGIVWKIARIHWVEGVPAKIRRPTSSSSAFSA